MVNECAALRVGDLGSHSSCCGPNTWKAVRGSSSVIINHRPAMRRGDLTQHCGGAGRMIAGSSNVIIEDPKFENEYHWIEFVLTDSDGDPIPGVRCQVELPDGVMMNAMSDENGSVRFEGIDPGQAKFRAPGLRVSK